VVKLVIAVTDGEWFEHLRRRPDLPEVNFWAPSGAEFKALQPGELFLFKLHAPRNFIVGGGVFAHANVLPCSLAWEAFGEANGASTLIQMRARIAKYKKADPSARDDFPIGCRVLTQPFFLDEAEWLPVPSTWASNIVSFKGYSLDDREALALWELLEGRVQPAVPSSGLQEARARFGEPSLIRPRLGQGAFRVLVTDLYHRRCAVSGERTLPALEAAHIRPYTEGGEHAPQNGVLLRSDLHRLFDAGYVTITPEHRFEVSRRIKDEFENGKDYYRLHGGLVNVPVRKEHQPSPSFLSWHNGSRFRA
jgi:putative restriction endonuclease